MSNVSVTENSNRPRYYHINARENPVNLDEIKRIRPEIIVIHIYYECRYYEYIYDSIHLEDIIDVAHEIRARIRLITGSARQDHIYQWKPDHPHRVERNKSYQPHRYNIVDLEFWQTFNWLQQKVRLDELPLFNQVTDEELVNNYNRSFYYLFITLNNIVKNNRCVQMDTLAKYDILDRGTYSWQSWNDKDGRDIINSLGFKFKYWHPEIKILDQFPRKDDVTDLTQHGVADGYIPPQQLATSFLQIVTETHYTEVYFTEKTSTPLYFGKLFLVNGARHFHRILENLGFKLYTEIFDYAFDEEEDLEKRTDMLTHNIFRLRNKSPSQLIEMYKEVLPKILYNKQHLRQISISVKEVPHTYREIWQQSMKTEWGGHLQRIHQAKAKQGR